MPISATHDRGKMIELFSHFRTRRFWLAFVILFAAKAIYLFWKGPSFEPDSWGYVTGTDLFEQPPLYIGFLALLNGIWTNITFVCLVQIVLFALAASWLLCAAIYTLSIFYGAAVLVALEPYGSYFSVTLMSESVFLSLLFAILAVGAHHLKHPGDIATILLLGIMMALLYLTRYIGNLMPPAFLLFAFLHHRTRRHAIRTAIVLFIAYQAALLPVRIGYKIAFDTYRLDGLPGTVMWSHLSFFYPDSRVRREPLTEFEAFAAARDSDEYSLQNTFRGYQICYEESTLLQYVAERGLTKRGLTELSDSLARTSSRILREFPVRFVIDLAIPNLVRPLREDMLVVDYDVEHQGVKRFMIDTYGHLDVDRIIYRHRYWLVAVSLFVVTLVMQGLLRGPLTLNATFIIVYILLAPAMAVVCLRFMVVLTPLILVNLAQTVDGFALKHGQLQSTEQSRP